MGGANWSPPAPATLPSSLSTTAQQLVLRARIILLAAAELASMKIAARVGVCVDTVRKWRHRWWVQPGTASLGNAKRSGRPPSCTPVQVAAVKALADLAAYDVHRAKIYGRCEATTGIAPFTALVEQVMAQEPYASADRVFWVVDNGLSHRRQKAIDRLAEHFPNAVMVHTPVHASWLNQVKVYFSIIQRKALSPNDFTDLAEIEQRLIRFEVR